MKAKKYPLFYWKLIFSGYILFLAATDESCAQTSADKIDALVHTYATYGKFNGSILVADHGAVIYKKGFGLANVEQKAPNQPDTKFRLASVTKQFTAMLIVQLAAENKLKLDATVSTYLPDYPRHNGERITLHQLLTHTSGIPDYTSFPNFRDIMGKSMSPRDLVDLFADAPLDFAPGERFQYSNSGYILLGYIIEQVTGKSYEQVLREKILTPLGMSHSGYDHHKEFMENRATGYDTWGSMLQEASYIDMSVPFSAGALYSTVEDLYLWDQALYTEKLLPKKYLDWLFEKHIPAFGELYYGYGWNVSEMPVGNSRESIITYSHGGSINGFATLITRMPTTRSTVILLNNTSGAPLTDMTVAITGILGNKPYALPKKPLAGLLSEMLMRDGIPATLAFYENIKDSAAYELNEFEINTAGYSFLQAGKAREAAILFKINVEAFPNSFNVYDSYGEALLATGDTTGAIENYKLSLKLNPESESGRAALENMGVKAKDVITTVLPEFLQLVSGEYTIIDSPTGREWKITFAVENGVLHGNDRGYKYKVLPVGANQFVNPDDGASLVFDTTDHAAIRLTLMDRFVFEKVK